MYDACHDSHQDVFRWFPQSSDCGCIQTSVRKSIIHLTALNPSHTIDYQDVSVTTQTHLLYTRFRTVALQLAPLLGELERRSAAHPEELSALLSECHSAYFSSRRSLLVGGLIEEIKGLDPAHTELVELVCR